MKMVVYCIVCICFLLSSCAKSNVVNESFEHNISIGKSEEGAPIRFSDIFKSVDIIPLETSDEFLISSISQLRCADDKIFILDKKQSVLFIFDSKGNALNKISDRGDDPNQYSNIRGFDIDIENKQVYLYTFPYKLFKYDFDGKFIEKIDQFINCSDIAIYGENIAIYSGNSSNDIDGKLENNKLWIKKINSKKVKGYEEFDPNKVGTRTYVINQDRNFYHFKDEVLFFHPFSNKIYSIKEDTVTVKYYMDFGERNLPDNYFEQFQDPKEAYDRLSESNYASKFYGYWENDKYFSINCGVDKGHHSLFYDKLKGKAKLSYFEDDMTFCSPSMEEATDEYLVAYVAMETLIVLADYMESKGREIFSSNKELSDLFKKTSQEGNPIVFFYKFK